MLRSLARGILGRLGFELVRLPDIFFIQANRIDLVLDVGANEGQFAEQLRTRGYKGRIISFEPVSSAFAQLQLKSTKDKSWTAVQTAIGASRGQTEISVSAYTVYSSIKPKKDIAAIFDPRSTSVRNEAVPIITLDEFMAEQPYSSIFLKVDTQGFEQEVLLGATESLRRVVGLQLELPIEHLYEGVWSFQEAIAYLETIGFVPAKFRMVNASARFPGSGMEFDCVFRREQMSANVAPIV